MHSVDQFIMSRCVIPVAHWIDYRFHRNQYDVAAWLYCVTIFSVTVNTASIVTLDRGAGDLVYKCIMVAFGAGFVLMYGHFFSALKKASEVYERRKESLTITMVPKSICGLGMISAVNPFAVVARLISVLVGGSSAALYQTEGHFHAVGIIGMALPIITAWNLFDGLGRYFADVPNTPHKRKEKQAWLPSVSPAMAAR